MDSKDIEPFFMDLRYLEPISDVIRLEDARFRGYPHEPQLFQRNRNKISTKQFYLYIRFNDIVASLFKEDETTSLERLNQNKSV